MKLPFLIAVLGWNAVSLSAQELEPRAYSPAPVGTKFLIAGLGGSKGSILLDPSLDVADVQADLHIVTVGGGYTFGLGGRQARVLAVLPIAWGRVTGEVGGQVRRQDLAGLADPRIKLSLGLRGAPALKVAEFAGAPRRTIVGASLTFIPPLGQYNPGQIANIGYNRWGFKPEIGISRPFGRVILEGYSGVWLFTTNTLHYPGRARKEQDPILALQGHVSYTLPRRAWIAFDATWFAGGQTRVDGVLNPDLQRNSRLGAALSIPVSRNQSVKFVYSTGASTRRGSDFDTVSVTLQTVWF